MNALTRCIFLAIIILSAACSGESDWEDATGTGGNDNGQEAPGDTSRRELLLTFNNTLAASASTKAGTAIATPQENEIATLDIFVFASKTRNGAYSFMERFSYRQAGAALPAGATKMYLDTSGEENTFTTLLDLQKGFFVKLYCIANFTDLWDASRGATSLSDSYFQPLKQSNPGQPGSVVATPGVPVEADFLALHTPLLSADASADTLVCPLPMRGSLTEPLDLTDYRVTDCIPVGMKLIRMVARFDVINDARTSMFTIEAISLLKGRRGVFVFSGTPYGSVPADPAVDLITCPPRAFYGTEANAGTRTGAYYMYPSPATDGAGLLLKGKYRINLTEQKDVSYHVPFTQFSGSGAGASLEIQGNHQYTLTVMRVDAVTNSLKVSFSE